jgi:hypothetical protein
MPIKRSVPIAGKTEHVQQLAVTQSVWQGCRCCGSQIDYVLDNNINHPRASVKAFCPVTESTVILFYAFIHFMPSVITHSFIDDVHPGSTNSLYGFI